MLGYLRRSVNEGYVQRKKSGRMLPLTYLGVHDIPPNSIHSSTEYLLHTVHLSIQTEDPDLHRFACIVKLSYRPQ